MKKRRKPHHQSPRLSAVSSSAQYSANFKPGIEPQPDDALALALDVVEPLPLEIQCPSVKEGEGLRRSPRFTSNKDKTPNSKSGGRRKAAPALLASQLRRSPRFSSAPSSAALASRIGGNVTSGDVGSNKRCRSAQDNEARAARIGKKAKMYSDDLSLRRSLRLSGGKIDHSNLQLVALPKSCSKQVARGCLSEKSLRSRTVLIYVGYEKEKVENVDKKKHLLIASSLNESPEVLEKRTVRRASGEVHSDREGHSSARKIHVGYDGWRSAKTARKINVGYERRRKSAKSASTKGNVDCRMNGKDSRSLGIEFALIELPEASEARNARSRLNQDEAFEVPEESPSGERCLRSWSAEMELPGERVDTVASGERVSRVKSKEKCVISPETESALNEKQSFSERKENEQCDSELTSEKCLRSRKAQFKESTEGIAKETIDPVVESNCSDNECNSVRRVMSRGKEGGIVCCFVGEPVPEEVAQKRWQWRYELKRKNKARSWKLNADEEDEIILNVKCHYTLAKVGNYLLDIGDCVYVKGEGTKQHVGRILEFFQTTKEEDYFRVQWFYRAEDTVLKYAASLQDERRVFYSTVMNDNPLDCIISKVNVEKVPPTLSIESQHILPTSLYYDMEYCVDYSTFRTLKTENEPLSMSSESPDEKPLDMTPLAAVLPNYAFLKPELALLDLYSGCGGMSTGLCAGAKLSRINLVTKWAVDYSGSACDSLKLNHPETQVRNETADDFLELLKKWEILCKLYVCDSDSEPEIKCESGDPLEVEAGNSKSETQDSSEEYEVSHLIDICYGDPNENGKRELHFKVHWKGYGSDEDTWEPIEGLSNCQERIEEFVRRGFKSKILPLPGDADVICGGPPCQGISGYNRHRNFESPLTDDKNRQIIVFMDIVEFLKPRYVLMENVADIIKFDKGSLGRYALSRLVGMKYQARLGTIASGCYGLPQFRLRVFIWGAHPTEVLPQFPLPTHDVVVKYWPPLEFERNVVAYDEGQPRPLQEAIILRDAISDLPPVTNDEQREEMAYENPPETDFQANIRLNKDDTAMLSVLYDHRPLQLSEHDHLRVCQVPHRKGANFRDFPGLIVGEDNVVRRDPSTEPVMLPTGRPLVLDYVFKFESGKSKRPYARVWWDETVSTVVTYPHIRTQAILHPEQDRCLTIRECARLQGFPDHYRFCGSVKDRYCQVGNAVSIPVARALGYALGMAFQRVIGDEPLMTLPLEFSSRRPSGPSSSGWVSE